MSGPTPTKKGAYYLIESNGGVRNFGGAAFYGSKANAKLSSPIVGGALSADGAGYWLASARGNVYNYGDALYYGAPVHSKRASPIVAMAATPDGGGYWLVSARGVVYNYGDAPSCGAPSGISAKRKIVAVASSPDGMGYWLIGSRGAVYNFGDAAFLGSAVHNRLASGIVGFAPTLDGAGYWLVTAKGAMYRFGDAPFFGSAVHKHFPGSIIALGLDTTGLGYWLATSTGRVFNFGDAAFGGSLAHQPPPASISVVGFLASFTLGAGVAPIPHHVFGYDISNFQCAKQDSSKAQSDLPPSSGISVLEAAGWLDGADNSCIAAEAAWATRSAGQNGTPYELYLFLNSPGTNAAALSLAANGPRGACARLSGYNAQQCIAYNYGFNGAKQSLTYTTSVGVHSLIWWVDVENDLLSKTAYSDFAGGVYWSASVSLNAATIQGAMDALRANGSEVGIYSTSVQFPKIAGTFRPDGPPVPLWVAGVPWTKPPYNQAGLLAPASLSSWCAGTAIYIGTRSSASFAGGVPWILQETPGSIASPYGLDPDYTC